MDLNIRQLKLPDLKMAIRLSEAEGWNQTEKDWRMVLDNPDDICIGAEYDGRIIGTSNAIIYEKKLAWIGMVLVETQFRRQGIGKMLFGEILEKLSNLRSIKLDATPAGQPLYEKFGFREEYRIDRMINMNLAEYQVENNSQIKHVSERDLAGVVLNDSKIFGADRSSVLENLFRNYPGKAYILNDSFILGRDGKIFSYAGPLYASSSHDALILLQNSLRELTGKPVAVDVPESKAELRAWLEGTGFTKQRSFMRMYYRTNEFRGFPQKQYLILGPEFG